MSFNFFKLERRLADFQRFSSGNISKYTKTEDQEENKAQDQEENKDAEEMDETQFVEADIQSSIQDLKTILDILTLLQDNKSTIYRSLNYIIIIFTNKILFVFEFLFVYSSCL